MDIRYRDVIPAGLACIADDAFRAVLDLLVGLLPPFRDRLYVPEKRFAKFIA